MPHQNPLCRALLLPLFLEFPLPKQKPREEIKHTATQLKPPPSPGPLTATYRSSPFKKHRYLFGLFANLAASTSVSLLGFPTSYEIIQFAANGDIASVAVRFLFQHPALNLSLPVVIYIWSAFNAAGEVAQYDATFRRFEWMIDTLTQIAGAQLGAKTPEEAQEKLADTLAQSICGTAERYCNGTNVQYDDTPACYKFFDRGP